MGERKNEREKERKHRESVERAQTEKAALSHSLTEKLLSQSVPSPLSLSVLSLFLTLSVARNCAFSLSLKKL
jgi:hypothetical protein